MIIQTKKIPPPILLYLQLMMKQNQPPSSTSLLMEEKKSTLTERIQNIREWEKETWTDREVKYSNKNIIHRVKEEIMKKQKVSTSM